MEGAPAEDRHSFSSPFNFTYHRCCFAFPFYKSSIKEFQYLMNQCFQQPSRWKLGTTWVEWIEPCYEVTAALTPTAEIQIGIQQHIPAACTGDMDLLFPDWAGLLAHTHRSGPGQLRTVLGRCSKKNVSVSEGALVVLSFAPLYVVKQLIQRQHSSLSLGLPVLV